MSSQFTLLGFKPTTFSIESHPITTKAPRVDCLSLSRAFVLSGCSFITTTVQMMELLKNLLAMWPDGKILFYHFAKSGRAAGLEDCQMHLKVEHLSVPWSGAKLKRSDLSIFCVRKHLPWERDSKEHISSIFEMLLSVKWQQWRSELWSKNMQPIFYLKTTEQINTFAENYVVLTFKTLQ